MSERHGATKERSACAPPCSDSRVTLAYFLCRLVPFGVRLVFLSFRFLPCEVASGRSWAVCTSRLVLRSPVVLQAAPRSCAEPCPSLIFMGTTRPTYRFSPARCTASSACGHTHTHTEEHETALGGSACACRACVWCVRGGSHGAGTAPVNNYNSLLDRSPRRWLPRRIKLLEEGRVTKRAAWVGARPSVRRPERP